MEEKFESFIKNKINIECDKILKAIRRDEREIFEQYSKKVLDSNFLTAHVVQGFEKKLHEVEKEINLLSKAFWNEESKNVG